MPVYPQKFIFGAIPDFPGILKSSLGASFSAKSRHRPVSGVSNKRSQHQRSAAFGGLPSLPAGVHPGNQNGSKNRTFLVHCRTFLVHFRYQNLASFLACLFYDMFAILVPLWLPFGSFGAFWMHFGFHFGSILAQFWLILALFL